MNRRTFLSQAGGLSLALAAAPALPLSGFAPRKRLFKALKFGMVDEPLSILDKFKLLKEIGFDGVELDSPSDLDPQEVVDARDATGLLIPGLVDSVHWRKTLSDPDPAVREEGRAALEHALREGRRYGCTTVLLVPAVVNKEVSYAEAYERSQAEIRKVLPLAREVGVKIALENVWNQFLLSPLEFARYIDEFDSPWIGAHFDIGNIVNYGWPEQWIRTLGPRILKLDVKEFSREKRNDQGLWEGFKVEIGEGDCDWPAVNAALADIGYVGWAAAEVSGGNADRLRDIAARMDRVLPTV
ncbi:MAG: sugar phosphate isomerase/epimerase family protein [Rhodothermales bacterium]